MGTHIEASSEWSPTALALGASSSCSCALPSALRRLISIWVRLVDQLLDRIHAPVGLDVGAETPEEIAISVAAELVMLRRGGTGASLKDVERVADRFFKEAE